MLRDQVDLFGAALGQTRACSISSSAGRGYPCRGRGDGAKVAGVVAAFGDFQKGIMRRGQLRPLVVAQAMVWGRREVLVHDAGKAVVVFKGDPLVDFWNITLQVFEVAFGQATSDKNFRIVFALFGGIEDMIDRLALRVFDKAAGIDQNEVGIRQISGQAKITTTQGCHQVLKSIVLRAAQADQGG